MADPRTVNNRDDGSIVLPKWFIWLQTVAAGVLTPVGTGMVILLWGINNRLVVLETKLEYFDKVEAKIHVITDKLDEHRTKENHPMTGIEITVLQKRIEDLEKRVYDRQTTIRPRTGQE